MSENKGNQNFCRPPDLSDDDVIVAMKEFSDSYIDITPGDFKEVFALAYRHAVLRLTGALTAGEVMTVEVVSVKVTATVGEVAGIIAKNDVSGVPVLDERQKVVGVISEKDFITLIGGAGSFMSMVSECLRGKGCPAFSFGGKTARDIMTAPAVTVTPKTLVSEIAKLFRDMKINRVPVVDSDGGLVGIVSRGDLF
jgi:CBS-domain-containing membrane protein